MRRSLLLLVLLLVALPACAGFDLGGGARIEFVDAAEGAGVLGRRDAFVERMSAFDRAARLKSATPVSEAQYLDFAAAAARDWSAAERERVASALQATLPRIVALGLQWPRRIVLVKTSGAEEAGAFYTRGEAIMLPATELAADLPAAQAETLQKVLPHELFHILSRSQPALKTRLYAAIGYRPCGEVAHPPALAARRLTNPDAPANDHCIQLEVDGRQQWAVPLLYADAERYDPARGGEFFDYLKFEFLLVNGAPGKGPGRVRYDPAAPRLVGPAQVGGLFEQVGRNTRYIIHPEEVLADNFSLLLRPGAKVESPEVLARIAAVLEAARTVQ